ncbi:CARDB domain-containing protein [Halorientalis pallida]|uniref:CARDB domain-containing protein n=1 Tax=Halorientalis pallida TaxID=2479928 RepID=A0A498KVE8_9EURY|nr:CARDB domain-containing protein [Halorientalis pallida]RXK48478.1 hypothetical protein EAF64_12415 [Halorientalis pallida]
MHSSTRTGATLALFTLLVAGVIVGTAPAVAQADETEPSFEFDDGSSADFGLAAGDESPAFGGDADENDSDDGGPGFDFGGGEDDGGPEFEFGGNDSSDGDGGESDDGDGNETDGNETDGESRPIATFRPTITGTNSPVTAGEALDVIAAVENTGEGDGQQTVTLTVDDAVRDSRQVVVAAGERRTVTLSWDTAADDAGTYTATVATANGTSTASLTVENDTADGGDDSVGNETGGNDSEQVLPFRPSSFDAYVQGETAYLHSGVDNGSFPIEFTECEDFQPTAAARAENPDYLPLDSCIRLNGTVDEETDTWTGELNFPRITGAIADTRPIGDVYYSAEIVTTEPVTGTFDLSTGEITGETSIRLNITVFNVDHIGVPWDQRLNSEESPPLTNATCHIPSTELRLSTEKSFEADSPVAAADVMAGQRLNDNNETQVVTDDFAADGAAGCGETFGVDVNREIDYELGLPAGPGENELALDFALDLER